ncbi:uncharacterized protein LOC121737914 isoform X2 [Aricia agestis]|uniref:uncharacterized protein LOC121737914 isoform X2 n=1 Tax=Aricia agestis TaxID=91739 RepID=UPI001C2099C2|nr:uncharacterized protein LOC121737914 isoform X2 [Aricia agestis]
MGSNILNMYHQAPYRNIGHKVLRATSESGTSESSCTQNSPEYTNQKANDDSEDGEYWDDKQQVWSQSEQVNITKTNHDVSFDENEHIDVQNVSVDDSSPSSLEEGNSSDEGDCNSLVEGDDYDIIQVIAVDPDLDLASSDEEQEECADATDDEYINPEEDYRIDNDKVDTLGPNDLGINLDAPVVSNVDEYFIKNDDKILEAKDEPVVKDVDEYFIKEPAVAPNVAAEDRSQYDQGIDFRITESKPIVDSPVKAEPMKKEVECTNDNDLEGLSNIDYLKNFILDDLQNDRFRIAPRSQNSVSLPQTPMHNLCMDIDAKTCFSFEDLDLNDLSFENFKDKSSGSNKNDDIPRTLTDEEINSFLITDKKGEIKPDINENVDDLTHQDMEIEKPLDSFIKCIEPPEIINTIPERSSTPLPKAVLDFCIEKSMQSPVKTKVSPVKLEVPDFVDIKTCNKVNLPVLKANNLNSLLEQFEASEKLTETVVTENRNLKTKNSSRMRLQDAGIQLNKNKMRHILMPTTVNATITRSPSPVHADHDYCSTKKRHSASHLKSGRSLLKPDVLSSNNEILNSRHRSCKSKKIIYSLSSDDESDNKDKKKLNNRVIAETDLKSKKSNIKISKPPPKSKTIRKKEDVFSELVGSLEKSNGSVIVDNATKASDICSQNSSGSIKLTIKNKSEVILNNVDVKDNKNDNFIDKQVDSSVSIDKVHKKSSSLVEKNKIMDSFENKDIIHQVDTKSVKIKDEDTNPENFYTTLFDEKDVHIPQNILVEVKEEIKEKVEDIVEQQPAKKKKLNLQEYKLRRGFNSNASSAQVSPESIFPETPNLLLESCPTSSQSNTESSTPKKEQSEEAKTIFDPIREASRKIIMISRKQKVEAMRKKEEELLMRNIGKVETLEIQPLISDSEMMKIIGMAPEVVPVLIVEKVPAPADYDEVVLVSVGTNTDENMFKTVPKSPERNKRKCDSPPTEKKSNINFKIRKNDQLLKHNVFDSHRKDNGVENREHHHNEGKIDKERYKDIKATLKSVEKQVDTKISNNSLFASIQDVVMKKAPSSTSPSRESHRQKRSSSADRSPKIKTTIVREYDVNAEHGEDKVILHLKKNTEKPKNKSECCQTDSTDSKTPGTPSVQATEVAQSRSRHDSDMSLSSEEETPVEPKDPTPSPQKEVKAAVAKPRVESNERVQQKEKLRASENRYDSKCRRSRSHSRGRRRNGSPVRRRSGSPRRRSFSPRRRSGSPRRRSRSRDRYRSYRRRESPYRRNRRSRSPYRPRRSPSRRDYKTSRTRSRSRHNTRKKSRTPVPKRQSSPKYNNYRASNDKKPVAQPQPARKPTVSESSYSSSVSRSSSVSKTSTSSSSSSSTSASFRKDEGYSNKGYTNSFSSEDRENNTPVEERRIVFVGKLEKDITKGSLRTQFSKFGPVTEVRLHSKEDGSRYGFVTYQRPRDAWTAVENASLFPQYDVGFGGRRAFCRQSYADLDGLEAKYTESAFHGQAALPIRRNDDMSFEQMLLDMKNKLNKRKDKRDDTA